MLIHHRRSLVRLLSQKIKSASMTTTTTEEVETVQANLKQVLEEIHTASTSRGTNCRLVAVSKTKPSDLIRACYAIGQRHFGENYANELEVKSKEVAEECPEIRWHYIGAIQTNKVSKICSSPNLSCVETLESEKHCSLFDKEMNKRGGILEVLIQVNTSNEENKGGIPSSRACELAEFVKSNCKNLRLAGFMTIGSIENSKKIPNPDFDVLFQVREEWAQRSGEAAASLTLSMGMSGDYETAIMQGSTSVRVGSKIFGPRIYKK